MTDDSYQMNARVARALGMRTVDAQRSEAKATDAVAKLPPTPDVVTADSVCDWIRQVIPLLDAKSRYRKKLISIVQRHDFRVQRAKAMKQVSEFVSA